MASSSGAVTSATKLTSILKEKVTTEEQEKQEIPIEEEEAEDDLLPRQLRETVIARLQSDTIVCLFLAVVVFGIHCSTVFTSHQLQPGLGEILWIAPSVLGFLLHYILPQMRKQLPWLCFSHPLMRSQEYEQFEVHQAAKLMWFERIFLWLTVFERYILLPALFLDVLTHDSPLLGSMEYWSFSLFSFYDT